MDTLNELVAELPARGDAPAVIAFEGGAVHTLSFAGLADRANSLAGGLQARGVVAGEAIGLFAPNSTDWIVTRLALAALGAVAIHLDPEWRGERIAHAVRLGKAWRVFTVDALADHVREAVPDCEILILGDPELPGEAVTAMARPARDDVAALFFTSGTTGLPKAVPLTHRNILCNVEALLEIGLVRPDDRALLPLPLYHAYPFIVGLLVPLAAGIPVVLPEGVSGPDLARALTDGEVSVIVGVPRLYAALYDGIAGRARGAGRVARLIFGALLAFSVAVRRHTGQRIGKTLFHALHKRFGPRVRLLASGGAKLDAGLAWRLEGLGWEVLNGYGLVETASIATFERPGEPRAGTAGQPAPHTQLRISPTEGWDEPGTGEVEIGGPLVFAGYVDSADANRAAFHDGWFRTGDVGRIDADGYLHIVGRVKEMIVTAGGKKLSPEDVERAYTQSPFIRELAVIEDGDALAALVAPELDAVRAAGGGRIEDIVRIALGEVSRTLPSYERVTRFALTRERLPRTRLGKLQRFALPDIYARAKRAEPPVAPPLSEDDRKLLEDPVAKSVFDWLAARFPGHTITPDTTPQLDLGIDSLAWVGLGMELDDRLGVRLSEDAVARAVTVRDLLHEVMAAGASSESVASPENARRHALMADRERWAAPQSPLVRAIGLVLYAIALPLIRIYFWLRVERAGEGTDFRATFDCREPCLGRRPVRDRGRADSRAYAQHRVERGCRAGVLPAHRATDRAPRSHVSGRRPHAGCEPFHGEGDAWARPHSGVVPRELPLAGRRDPAFPARHRAIGGRDRRGRRAVLDRGRAPFHAADGTLPLARAPQGAVRGTAGGGGIDGRRRGRRGGPHRREAARAGCGALPRDARRDHTRQKVGLSRTSTVYISSRPSSMPADISHFAASGRVE